MSKTGSASAKGLRGKIIVIGLLTSTLAGLLGQEFLVATISTSPETPTRKLPNVAKPTVVKAKKKALLPEVDLEKVVAFDPFAPPASLSEASEVDTEESVETANAEAEENARRIAEEATLKTALQKLKQTGVRTIVETPSGKAAIVGASLVREGDLIDGFRVIRISKDGIDLAVERQE